MENENQGALEIELEAPVTIPDSSPPADPPGTLRDGKVVGAEAPAQTEQKPQTQQIDPEDQRATDDGWKQRARRNERRAQKAESQVARLMGEFADVKKQLETLSQGQTQVQQATAVQHEQAVDAAFQSARQSYAQARQAGDLDAEQAALDRYLEAKAAKDWINFGKQNAQRRPAQQQPQQKPQPQQPAADESDLPEAAQDWLAEPSNAWFKADARLRRRAMVISDEIVEEGITGDDPEHYAEVTRRMKEEYGENFAAPKTPNPSPRVPGRQPVTPVNRTASPVTRVQITEAHRQAAAQAGIDLRDPAQAKAFANQIAQTQARFAARGVR